MRQRKHMWLFSLVFIGIVLILTATILSGQLRSGNRQATAAAEATNTSSQTCTRQAASRLEAINLSDAQPGLTEIISQPTEYTIYGNTPDELRQQIAACAPSENGEAEFTGETSYRLSWQYGFARTAAGSCTVTDAKVGIRIGMTLPLWQPTVAAPKDLASEWQTFAGNLHTHENGHVELDKQYARDILDDLRNYPASDCATIAGSVEYLVQNSVNALNQANDNYDTTTNHGATQGAILPQ